MEAISCFSELVQVSLGPVDVYQLQVERHVVRVIVDGVDKLVNLFVVCEFVYFLALAVAVVRVVLLHFA